MINQYNPINPKNPNSDNDAARILGEHKQMGEHSGSPLQYFIPLKWICVKTPSSLGRFPWPRGSAYEGLFHPFAGRKFYAGKPQTPDPRLRTKITRSQVNIV
jgi:hypothetical protein